jgi:hypothetical protein
MRGSRQGEIVHIDVPDKANSLVVSKITDNNYRLLWEHIDNKGGHHFVSEETCALNVRGLNYWRNIPFLNKLLEGDWILSYADNNLRGYTHKWIRTRLQHLRRFNKFQQAEDLNRNEDIEAAKLELRKEISQQHIDIAWQVMSESLKREWLALCNKPTWLTDSERRRFAELSTIRYGRNE